MTAATALTVSFELGTNPDINTVNVNNRVQTALAAAAAGGAAPGRHRAASGPPRFSQFMQFYSEAGKQDPLFISNYVTINVLDQLARTPGVGQALAVRQAQLLDAHLVRHRPADQPEPGAVRHHRGDPAAERAGAGRPHRRPADRRRPAIPAQRADPRPADHAGAVRRHRAARQSGRLGAARRATWRGSSSARPEQDTESRLNGKPAVSIGLYLAPGRQRGADLDAGAARRWTTCPTRFPAGPQGAGLLRQQRPSSPTRSAR